MTTLDPSTTAAIEQARGMAQLRRTIERMRHLVGALQRAGDIEKQRADEAELTVETWLATEREAMEEALAAETSRADEERARANEWLAQRSDLIAALRAVRARYAVAGLAPRFVEEVDADALLARIDAAEAAPAAADPLMVIGGGGPWRAPAKPRRFAVGDQVRVTARWERAGWPPAGTLGMVRREDAGAFTWFYGVEFDGYISGMFTCRADEIEHAGPVTP